MRRWVCFLIASFVCAQPAADALFERARAAQMAGRLAEAESGYEEYVKRYGPKAEVLANLGALLARRENYPEAIRRYREALKANPSLAPIHLNLGLAYLKQGQPAPAATEFELFLRTQPGNRQAMQLRAMALLDSEQYEASEKQYRALLPSDDVTIALGLSTALIRQKKTAEARAVLDPVLTREGTPESDLVLGQVLLQEGRIEDALKAFEHAQNLNPTLPHLRVLIGSVYWQQRKTEQALRQWRAQYQDHPQDFEAAYMLGSALSLQEATRGEAEAILRKAVALRPSNAAANYQLAKLVWQKSKNPEAVTFLQRATQSDPEFREAFFFQGTVLQSLGRKAEAARAFARVKELSAKEVARQQDLFSESQ